MATLLLGVGLVFIVEGLAWALAPSLIEQLLAALRALDQQQRRSMGLGALALGLALVLLAKKFGA